MGILRVILALSVVLFHCFGEGRYSIVGAFTAVQGFFIISGFYMSLILNEKYVAGKGVNYLFYSNRVFRLMPLYFFYFFISLGLAVLCYSIGIKNDRSFFVAFLILFFDTLNLPTFIYIILSNVLVIGHDLAVFLGINPDDGSLFFTSTSTYLNTYRLYFIPQAWTLSIELYFYLLAPFIVRRFRNIVIIIALSLGLRVYLYSLGYSNFPWYCCFFPTELALFLLGSLSHRLYVFLNEKELLNNAFCIIISGIVFILTFCYPLLSTGNTIPNFFTDAQTIYYSCVAIGLPFLFHLTRKSRIDRYIGELSYPIYLCHLIIIDLFMSFFSIQYGATSAHFIILFFTLILAVIGVFFIQKRVDDFRQKRYQDAMSLSHD